MMLTLRGRSARPPPNVSETPPPRPAIRDSAAVRASAIARATIGEDGRADGDRCPVSWPFSTHRCTPLSHPPTTTLRRPIPPSYTLAYCIPMHTYLERY